MAMHPQLTHTLERHGLSRQRGRVNLAELWRRRLRLANLYDGSCGDDEELAAELSCLAARAHPQTRARHTAHHRHQTCRCQHGHTPP